MAQNITEAALEDCENYYQISDDDLDDFDDMGEDSLLEENDAQAASGLSSSRGPYERAWTTEATRALIHIRGPMEGRFTEGRQKRTALWLHCTRQLQKLGFRYSAAKVQKKWHNILITYNKNISKKYLAGHVHWEFFEEMYKYLQGKKADCEPGSTGHFHQQQLQKQQQQQQHNEEQQQHELQQTQKTQQQQQKQQKQQEQLQQKKLADVVPSQQQHFFRPAQIILESQLHMEEKSLEDLEDDCMRLAELKKPKLEYIAPPSPEAHETPSYIVHNLKTQNTTTQSDEVSASRRIDELINERSNEPAGPDAGGDWWQDYFERKLQMDREKIQLQKAMHYELMQCNKQTRVQQERMERTKIEAINNLTHMLQKLVESNRNRKI